MGTIYTAETIGARITERGLKTGDRLWVAGDRLTGETLRTGNSPSNAAIYLRWKDLGIAKEGKIEGEDADKQVIEPGEGLSMFIEKVVHADFNLIDSKNTQCGKSELQKLAKEKGYESGSQIHWFKMTEGKVMPVGLEVVFDNDPPGHCTLTVTRAMTVRAFLGLVEEHLGFDYVGTDIFGKK